MAKVSCRWTVNEKSRNVHEFKLDKSLASGGEAWVLWMADEHWDHPKCDLKLLAEHHREAAARGAAIIKVGDTFCVMQGRGDPRGDKGSVRAEHWGGNYLDLVVKTASEWYNPYRNNIKLIGLGNHECHDDETEILTRRGWVLFRDLLPGDSVATMNMGEGVTEYQEPTHIHRYCHSGEMIKIKARSADICVTGNHRMVYRTQHGGGWRFSEAAEAPEHFTFPVSVASGNAEWGGATDDEIRLCAWIITDGSIIVKTGRTGKNYYSLVVWQRKSKVGLITNLLEDMGYAYHVGERQRSIKSICGRVLVKEPEPECRVSLDLRCQRQRMLELVATKSRLPSWVSRLSDRQFSVFLEALLDGDGSRHRASPSSMMFYGKKSLLDDLQAECVTHGYKASLSVYREKQYRLNITHKSEYTLPSLSEVSEKVAYDGDVWCVTVPNGTTITRRNGRVAITGNSAVFKNHETDLIDRLCQSLRDKGGDARKGGYSGWTRFRVGWNGTKANSYVAFYHHGFGGGGPASKGMPDFGKVAEWVDADAIVSGHVHQKTSATVHRHRLNDAGRIVEGEVSYIRCGTYKNEFEDGFAGYHIENGRGPRPLGGWWMRLYVKNDKIQVDWVEAK